MSEISPLVLLVAPFALMGGLAVWIAIFVKWERGLLMLLAYLPFAGIVALALRPNPAGTLIKDLVFVVPLYASMLLLHGRSLREAELPKHLLVLLIALAVMVFAQWLNPYLSNAAVAAIGTKVWLFYIPLMVAASAFVKTRGDLVRLLRLMLVVATVPLGLGIFQYFLCVAIGYGPAMTLFYGRAAYDVTQGFSSFDFGGYLFRIPSTFTFVTQYFGFTLSMIVPAYALSRLEESGAWRRFAGLMLGVAIVAATLSGARAAFVFVPMMIGLTLMIDGRVRGLLAGLVVAPGFMLAALELGGLDPVRILGGTRELAGHYEDLVIYTIVDSLTNSPFGRGTGMNTGAARHGVEDYFDRFELHESLYAKAITELGVMGLAILVGIFFVIAAIGFQQRRRLQDRGLKSAVAALLAFHITIVVNSFKGWQIDLDPVNVYFWVFVGLIAKMHRLDAAPVSAWRERLAARAANVRFMPQFRPRPAGPR